MGFWLDRGASGFRVDMAFSLVKDDPGQVATMALWREIRSWLDDHWPEAVLIPEGVEPVATAAPGPHDPDLAASSPPVGGEAAFDADFFLAIGDEHLSLFSNGAAGRMPGQQPGPCFFESAGRGTLDTFLAGWVGLRQDRPNRPILLGTSDHDFARLACGERRGVEQLGVAFAFLLTWGSVPVIYYGDEIGLPYQPNLPNVEGSVCFPGFYNRAGARTPMHWDAGANAGFSTADAEQLYLPVDPSPNRVSVAAQHTDPESLLVLVRRLLSLRAAHPGLGARGDAVVHHSGYPFVYTRNAEYVVVVHPADRAVRVDLGPESVLAGYENPEPVFVRGVSFTGTQVHATSHSFGIFRLPQN
jgi:maltose alpha-D-glucosyltransferase/alpha-amylase